MQSDLSGFENLTGLIAEASALFEFFQEFFNGILVNRESHHF